jgi:choline dehydrogenase-like flavoprotein
VTIRTGLPEDDLLYDICVVGAGPLGIAAARRSEALGQSVILLESGGTGPDNSGAVYGDIVDPKRHAALDIAMCRALGGSSWWWGGRCLPMDPIDFEQRHYVPESGWPLHPDDLKPYEALAAEFLDCGTDRFDDPHPTWSALAGGVRLSALERWSRTREMAKRHGEHLAASAAITVCLETTVTAIVPASGAVSLLRVDHAGQQGTVRARTFILACGGLGTTRLLKEYQATHPQAFGGPQGALGHYYMGHTHGKIADIVLSDPEAAESVDFFLDDTGTWIRRRFSIDAKTQRAEGILNTAFWVDNAAFNDWRHRSGILSAVYLALSIPPIGRLLVAEGIRRMHVGPGGNYIRHLGNVVMHPLATAMSAWQILRQRYLEKPRRPGFLIRNGAGRYALTFHGEQLPVRESRAERTADGRLSVDLRFADADAVSVVRAHEILDRSLRQAGLGRLEYYMPEQERVAAVLAQATDGYHQEGLLRMGTDPATSVVDPNCRVHDLSNLYIASTGVFPTSGQANPTFTACALAFRLAQHLAEQGGERAAA